MTNAEIGLSGEFRVMSELLLRGHNPAKAFLDLGTDIILQNGIRIQVKTCSKRNISGAFVFNLSKGNDKRAVEILEYADFVILFIVELQLFYIMPTNVFDLKKGISIRPNTKSKYEKYLNNWDLLKRR